MGRQTVVLIVILVYMALMLAVGVYYSKKNNSISDYVLGGRQLNPWVAAMSAQASDMSGWLLTGLPGLAYLSIAGVKEAAWTAIGLAIGTCCNWIFTGKRLRSYTEVSKNSLTLPDYLENRFRDDSRLLRLVTAIASVVFFLIYTSSMFVAGGKLFSTIFGLDYTASLLITSLVVVGYTFLGGFTAVCVTDTIMGILMFFGVLIVPITGMVMSGGISYSLSQVDPATWQLFPNGDGTITALTIASAVAWGLGYFGQPHILVRFMAIHKPKDIKPAATVAMIWVILSLTAAVFVGIVGRIFLSQPLAEGQHETVFMVMVMEMFNPVLTGILISAILAAIMSTASSQLLVTSSALASDLYKGFIKRDADEKRVLWLNRVAVLVVSVAALIMGADPNSSIFGIVSYAWAGLGASFGPAVLMSLYWKRMTRRGAIAGVITGGLSTILFNYLKTNVGGIFSVYEILPAFILSVIVIVAVSLANPEPEQEIQEEFDKAVAYAKEH